jgi:SAM-dependent methyltransferase
MLKWYEGKPEAEYWRPSATPKALEAIRNRAEHPDDREEWEKKPAIKADHLQYVRDYMRDDTLNVGDPNPLYRPEPATEFYENTLTACWMEANRVLKPGGLLAFTFHHNDDRQWEAVLRSLFEAGFILVATYPIRSDETKGEGGAFGSRKIEYDILHVCRKRLAEPTAVSWAKMRRWVKEEVKNQQRILELYRNQDISEADIRVVLRGKALEFYSRHYGQVFTGSGEILSIRDALLGINQLLDDSGGVLVNRPPESAQPVTRLFLSLFQNTETLPRDDVHKMLRGTTVTIDDLTELGWVEEVNKKVSVVSIERRFTYLTRQGKRRDSIKLDLDIAHFVIGAAFPNSGFDIQKELSEEKLNLKPSVEAILGWYAEMSPHVHIRQASELGRRLLQGWRKNNLIKPTKPKFVQYALEFREEGEVCDT